ncbi:hypothetical protein B0I35DRAFT_495465 [Stachybotrys elegans]|uniref:Uncharacterized protein n=1 Tax=Stachybotrys elegans TaxID=80388 RepID=A0A8K0SCI3_9HYPO|nr:hypothetical protein B0I35DRAFT_495465 [Stachybotrys elegans]
MGSNTEDDARGGHVILSPGVFGIHMPIIYGEGSEKAFYRLQSQVMRETCDHSLLAWSPTASVDILCGVFAESPAQFLNCRDISRCHLIRMAPGMTERYSAIDFDAVVILHNFRKYALLDCHRKDDVDNVLAIPLIEQGGTYFRAFSKTELFPEETWAKTARSRILLSPRGKRRASSEDIHYFIASVPHNCELLEVLPSSAWSSSPRLIESGFPDQEGQGPVRLPRI